MTPSNFFTSRSPNEQGSSDYDFILYYNAVLSIAYKKGLNRVRSKLNDQTRARIDTTMSIIDCFENQETIQDAAFKVNTESINAYISQQKDQMRGCL